MMRRRWQWRCADLILWRAGGGGRRATRAHHLLRLILLQVLLLLSSHNAQSATYEDAEEQQPRCLLTDAHASCATGGIPPAAIVTARTDSDTGAVAHHLQDLVVMMIAVCVVFCAVLVLAILKKPAPRLLDATPRERLSWLHADHLFIFTDLAGDCIMIKNAAMVDIDLSHCRLRVEHAKDRGIYYEFKFPEGYLLVAQTTVSICYRAAARHVYVPQSAADRLDSRTCPRLRWPRHLDGPLDSELDSATLMDGNDCQIACESAILQLARPPDARRLSSDSSDVSIAAQSISPRIPDARMPADWH